MEVNARSRANSEGTDGGIATPIFSDAASYATAGTSPSQYSDDELVEIDKDTFEANVNNANAEPDFKIISKATFETNVRGTNANAGKAGKIEDVKIINGSTFGGTDPLHAMVQDMGREPKWWIEERERQVRSTSRKRKYSFASMYPHKVYVPAYFDKLPYSPQDYFTSGLEINEDPETSEEFWGKVGNAFQTSCRFETVAERRELFEEDYFDSEPPSPLTPELDDQKNVGGDLDKDENKPGYEIPDE